MIFLGQRRRGRICAAIPNIDVTPGATATGFNRSPPRNKPCPCGSGKKFKKCCLGKPQKTYEFVDNKSKGA